MVLDVVFSAAPWPLAHDALKAIGVAVAVLAALAFVNPGFLLPGLCTWLDGSHASANGGYVEFGPEERPTISAPAPCHVASSRADLGQKWATGSYTWRQ
jgi:hypothetical protein